jgi:hypothetical protein
MEELRKRAKELGIKSAHLYKDEEKLRAKIAEAEAEAEPVELEPAPEIEEPEEIADIEVVFEPEQEEKSEKPLNHYEVISGKFYYKGNRYVKGDFVESEEDLSPFTILKKV